MIYQLLLRRFVPFGLGFFTAVAAMGMFGSTNSAELETIVPAVQHSSGGSYCRDKTRQRLGGERRHPSPYSSKRYSGVEPYSH
jgi:hypothetical protein